MAQRFWVGGTATWDGTAGAKWSTTSGGASGAAVPTAADDVFLDAASGANTVTLSSSSVCRSLNCTGFTGTLSHPAATTLTIGDATAGASNIALKLVAGMTYTLGSTSTSAITFVSTSATQQTVDSGGKTVGNVTFNGAGGSWILSAALNGTASSTDFTLTAGSLDTNGQSITGRHVISSNTNVRSLSLGASTITLSGNGGGNHWEFSTVTNLTFNAGTSSIVISGTNTSFVGGGLSYYNVSLTGAGGGALGLDGTNTYNNLTLVSPSNTSVQIKANQIVNGLFSASGSAASTMGLMDTPTKGVQYTINAASVSIADIIIADINGAGAAAPFNATNNVGDMGGNSNITFTTPANKYWVATSGGSWSATSSWSLSSGGASGANPALPQDTAIFDANSITSGGRTITVNRNSVPSLDFTNVLNSPIVAPGITNSRVYIAGNLTMKSGMTFSGTTNMTFGGRGLHTIDTAGVTATNAVDINCGDGSYTLLSAFNCTSNVILQSGTFNSNTYNFTSNTFASSNSTTRSLNMGSSVWTITGAGTSWNVFNNANLTLTSGTSLIYFTNNDGTSKSLNLSTLPYYDIKIIGGGGGTYSFANGNPSQVNDFTVENGNCTLILHHSTTLTLLGDWNVKGTAGNLITIQSAIAANDTVISKSSGIVSSDYISLKDCTGTGGAYFAAGNNSTDAGNNTGWVFGAASFPLSLSDSVTVSDTATKSVGIAKSESVTTTDTAAKSVAKLLADSVSTTELIDRHTNKVFSDTITLSDAVAKDIAAVFNETVTITEDTSINFTQASLGGNLIEIENFGQSNILETTTSTADAEAGASQITVISTQNIATNTYALIGIQGDEQTELIRISSVSGSTITLASNLVRAHGRGTSITILRGNQITLFRAERDSQGNSPSSADYAEIITLDIDSDEVTTTYGDLSGTADSVYMFTYRNSATGSESTLTDSVAIDGGDTGLARGDYATIAEIRSKAGLKNNRWISDTDIDKERKGAQSEIDGILSGVYTLPFSQPINPTINKVTILLAAGALLTTDYGPMTSLNTDNGSSMIKEARAILEKLNTKQLVLVGENGSDTSIPGTAGSYSGWPNASTATTADELGGGDFMFRVSDRY